jgi:hypothetical protein
MKKPQVLLVSPPIFDFTAYDFWLRPYGMLRVAGQMRQTCALYYFDYLHSGRRDEWGRGPYNNQVIPKPGPLEDIPRYFRRFGRPRDEFREVLGEKRFDAVLVQTLMTYWYLGVKEVLDDIRELQPSAKIILGGIYCTLCPAHAQALGADLVVLGSNLNPLWQFLSIEPHKANPWWPADPGTVGVLKLTEGCPFRCTYCSAPLLWPDFAARPTPDCLDELKQMVSQGIRDIAFYDDALLFNADSILIPFLGEAMRANYPVRFHTPNALNARFVTEALSALMIQSGFTSFFFGLESSTPAWQRATGGKVGSEEFAEAVRLLRATGAESITTYIIVGHPDSDSQELDTSIRFAHQCGTKVLLSEFSPIPGTVDGENCSPWADLSEPLSHNKTAFAIRRMGTKYLNELKELTRRLNLQLRHCRIE